MSRDFIKRKIPMNHEKSKLNDIITFKKRQKLHKRNEKNEKDKNGKS